MRIPRHCKIERAASTDKTREHICCVHLDRDNRCVVATNGHMLVKLPAELEAEDTTGAIELEAIRQARKVPSPDDKLSISANGKLELDNGASFPRRDRGAYPPYQQVIPDMSAKRTVTFGLNAWFLRDLAEALGRSKKSPNIQLTVELPGEDGGGPMLNPIVVETADPDIEEGAIGVLMPVRL